MSNIQITSGGKERVAQHRDTLWPEFLDDPAITYMLSNMTREQRHAYISKYFDALVTASGLNKGVFDEANDWSSVAIWMPPGKRVDNPFTMLQSGFVGTLFKVGISGIRRMLSEWVPQADRSKKRGLHGEKKFWYLWFIGTKSGCRKQGLSSALIRKQQEVAARDNLPIWLEATTSNSQRLYASLGFETIDAVNLGRGKVGPDGIKQPDGEGITIWTMVWWPSGRKEEAAAEKETEGH